MAEVGRLDLAVYRAVANTRTPALDEVFARLSRAADYSRLSIALALGLSLAGGPEGRRAAARGIASVAVTAATVNLTLKPAMRRRRPDRTRLVMAVRRQAMMPATHSFPSGHSAAAFAFATGAGREIPWVGPPLYALAGLVGYSRVHAGVHYPLDVVTGALCAMCGRVDQRVHRSRCGPRGKFLAGRSLSERQPVWVIEKQHHCRRADGGWH